MFPFLPYEENIDLVAKSRFLLSLTNSDGASLSVMEGMAVGTVPILSDIPANREWVDDGVNGFLVPLDNVQAARLKIQAAFAINPERHAQMAALGRARIWEKGSLTRNMRRTSELMLGLLAGAK